MLIQHLSVLSRGHTEKQITSHQDIHLKGSAENAVLTDVIRWDTSVGLV